MKISKIKLKEFRRFADLTIEGISKEAKLIIMVGPNGCGKTSVFDAMNIWHRRQAGIRRNEDKSYYSKGGLSDQWPRGIDIGLYSGTINKGSFYFRTAYRNDPDFSTSSLSTMASPHEERRFDRLIDNDQVVSKNYQRLVHSTISSVYSRQHDQKTVEELRNELIGKIRTSMQNVFEDLLLSDIGDPLSGGAFFFKKGTSHNYHYKNLSGGEKAAFDLLLDVILKAEYYQDTVFAIDEPDLHMHTSLQGKLVKELFNVIPDNSQLWLSTHSLGVLKVAKSLAEANPNLVQFLDFHDHNFDDECILNPTKIDKVVWEKFLSIALEDLSEYIAPEKIFLCEGNFTGGKRNNFDASIYEKIFSGKYPNVSFVSGGSCEDLKKEDHTAHSILDNLLDGTEIQRILDKDELSVAEITALPASVKVLKKRHLEAYLLDDEVLIKFVISKDKTPKEAEGIVTRIKTSAITNSTSRGNPADDLKSASGEIYNGLKNELSLTGTGSNADAFMRDTLAPIITEDMNIYKELESEIF